MVTKKQAYIDRDLFTKTISDILYAYADIDLYRHLIKKQFAVSALLNVEYTDFLNIEDELSTLIYEIEGKYRALIQAYTKFLHSKKISELRKILTAFSTAITHLADGLLPYIHNDKQRNLVVGEREKVQNLTEGLVKHLNKIDRIPSEKSTSVNLHNQKEAA